VNLYVATSGSDANPCTQASPCLSFQRAYNLAQPGQVVEVAAGSYPAQTVNGTKSAPAVVFRPAAGASVSLAGINAYADNFEIQGMSSPWFQSFSASDGFTARNMDFQNVYVYGSSNTKVIGSDIGPSGGESYISQDNGIAAHNILFENDYWHDYRITDPTQHMTCMFVVSVDGLTVRGNKFVRCDHFGIFVQQFAGPIPPQNILLENNMVGQSTVDGSATTCCTYWGIKFSAGSGTQYWKNITVRNNSVVQEIGFETSIPTTNVSLAGNVADQGSCFSGVSYSHNLWYGGSPTCAASDRSVSLPGWVSAISDDLHLTAASPAIDAGDPANYAASDIDGSSRPMGLAPDAGADEAH
jgi:hypothetical protein